MTRANSDEHYVLDLCDAVLGRKGCRQHKFEFLRGDPGKGGRCSKLPVDAYYEDLNLVIEVMESQHFKETPFFDKPHRLTVSGVHRGEQRKLYDQRRRTVLPEHGITLITLDASLFRRGVRSDDEQVIREELVRFL